MQARAAYYGRSPSVLTAGVDAVYHYEVSLLFHSLYPLRLFYFQFANIVYRLYFLLFLLFSFSREDEGERDERLISGENPPKLLVFPILSIIN